MSYNSDELVAPDWVNGDFLKTVLEFNGDTRDVSILNYEITPGSGKGDHFASIMFRAKIAYKSETQDEQTCFMIIKTLPVVEGIKKEMLTGNQIDIFGGETFIYTKVLNRCSEILQKARFREKLAPSILYYAEEPHKVIVFEDLKELGYFMFPRMILDRAEAELIFNKLGQYHAAVYKMEKEGRDDLTKVVGTLFNMSGFDQSPIFQSGISFLHRVVATLPGFETVADKLAKISMPKLMEKCKNSLNKPSGYNLLNHGDYHIKNMMFNGRNTDDISSIILIDFQLCHWGTPAYDLYYVASALPYETRERYFRNYFDTFIDVLLASGFKGYYPTYEQLQKELKAYQHLDLQLLCSLAAFMRADPNAGGDYEFEEVMKNPDLFAFIYTLPSYVAYAKKALIALMEAGVLDDPDIMKSD